MNNRPVGRWTDLRSRRWWLYGLILVGSLVAPSLVVDWFFVKNTVASKLRHAIAEADRLDPSWRLVELESRREVLADEQNSAIQVRAVIMAFPKDWPYANPGTTTDPPSDGVKHGAALFDSLKVAPDVQLDAGQVAGLRAELEELAEALAKARILAGMPKGRYPITYDRVFFMARLDHVQKTRRVARLLTMDVILRTQEGDIDGSLDSCRSLLNVGRSLGDEPMAMSQLVRMAITSETLDSLQRVLAQGLWDVSRRRQTPPAP